jgi:hypothetical protein
MRAATNTIRETYARCHAVLYMGYEEKADGTKWRRVKKLRLFRDLAEAMRFYNAALQNGDALNLFIEPPMLDGTFTTVSFLGNDDDL